MEQSSELKDLASALCLAQSQFKDAKKSTKNGHLGNKYAALDDIFDAVKDSLLANGLSVVQMPSLEEGSVGLTTQLLHSSGQWLRDKASMPIPKDVKGMQPQQVYGSVLTYLRRYCLSSMLGIVADDDDDGEGTRKPAQSSTNTSRPPANQTTPRSVDAVKADNTEPMSTAMKDRLVKMATEKGYPLPPEFNSLTVSQAKALHATISAVGVAA